MTDERQQVSQLVRSRGDPHSVPGFPVCGRSGSLASASNPAMGRRLRRDGDRGDESGGTIGRFVDPPFIISVYLRLPCLRAKESLHESCSSSRIKIAIRNRNVSSGSFSDWFNIFSHFCKRYLTVLGWMYNCFADLAI